MRVGQNHFVGPTAEAYTQHFGHIAALLVKVLNDFRMNIFISEQPASE